MIGLADASRETVMRLNLGRRTGVYFIRNRINEKIYIGSAATSFSGRFRQHASQLRKGIHANRHLQGAWKQYGPISFECGVIEDCSPEQCVQCEQKWIDFFRPEYNICLEVATSALGVKRTPETCAKIAAVKRGVPRSEEYVAYLRIANKDRRLPPGANEASRLAWKGKHHSAEVRKILSDVHKGNKIWLGKKHSSETKEKMRKAQTGVKKTEEAKKNMRLAKRGIKISKEHVAALIAGKKRAALLRKEAANQTILEL